MDLLFSEEIKKELVFDSIQKYLISSGFTIIDKDESRPWGGFFVIDEQQAKQFITNFFHGFTANGLLAGKKLSPKILIVEPGKKLSWQYHHRRAELWKVIGGNAGIFTSDTDAEGEMKTHSVNTIIKLKQGERHRLIGLNNWGIIAEIWQHIDLNNPSDENDIIRVQDDYGR